MNSASPGRAAVAGPAPGFTRHCPGLLICAAIAALAVLAARTPWAHALGVSPLIAALALAMAAGNTLHSRIPAQAQPGLAFARQKLLRLGIILYGARLTFQDIAHIGFDGLLLCAFMLASTFLLALALGRLLKLERDLVILVGAGSAICGAAAILATGSLLRTRQAQSTVAVATVVLFGTLATFLYPLLYRALSMSLPPAQLSGGFGVYIGSTLHEVAQVVATGDALGAATAELAIVAKMARVMMLCPFLAVLAWAIAKRPGSAGAGPHEAPGFAAAFPWFALFFIGMVMLNSASLLPAGLIAACRVLDQACLLMAMVAQGLGSRLFVFREAGWKPFMLAAGLFLWLAAAGALGALGWAQARF